MSSFRLHQGTALLAALVTTGGAMGMTACADSPTTPVEARAPLAAGDQVVAAFDAAVADAKARLLPGTSDAVRESIEPLLDALAMAVRARDARGLESALATADAGVSLAAQRHPADADELSALRLVVDRARTLAEPMVP